MKDEKPTSNSGMNPLDSDQRVFYHLGPGAFPEVSQQRIQNLLELPAFQLKITIGALACLENGEDIELPEEFKGQSGEERLHEVFTSLLEITEDQNGNLREAATGFGSLEKFADTEAVGNLHKAIFDGLIQSGWSIDEVICADLIACGYFDISDLNTQ